MSVYVRVKSIISYDATKTTKERVIKDIIDITGVEEFEVDAEGSVNDVGCVSLIAETSIGYGYASEFTEYNYIKEIMSKIEGCLSLSHKIRLIELEDDWDEEESCGEEIDEFEILYCN